MTIGPFANTVSSLEELRDLYRAPSDLVVQKVRPAIDDASRAFIARSPFVLVGTHGPDGLDVSPRGGPAGFAKVRDDGSLVLPDLVGNNLLDTLTNVVRDGRIGLLFLVPGKEETLRVNGDAWVVLDDDVLDSFTDDVRRPKAAIGVVPRQVYVHCAKAFRRSALWEPETWAALADAPDGAAILSCQLDLTGDGAEDAIRDRLEQRYVEDLVGERPTS